MDWNVIQNYFIEYILPVIKNITASTVTLAAFWFVFRKQIEAFITTRSQNAINAKQHELDKKMEDYKSEIGQRAEAIKTNLQKDIINAELTIKQRHKTYNEILLLMRKAHALVMQFYGVRRRYDYATFSQEDAEKHIKDWLIADKLKKEILQAYATDAKSGAEKMKEYEFFPEHTSAWKSINEANNYWIANELYFPDEISKIIKDILIDFKMYLNDIEMIREVAQQDRREAVKLSKEPNENRKTFDSKMDALKNKLKTDLNASFF
ncbi:hypothetical protein K1X76_12375 [bacterium]|nr:hypothetical protein [bacterium]